MPVHVTPLSPPSSSGSAGVFPDKVAVVDGAARTTYAELAAEATRAARGLLASG